MGPHPLDGVRRPEALLAALGPLAGARVAEVGAGGGYLTPWLAAAVGADGLVIATDRDAEALAALRARTAGHSQVRAVAIVGDETGLEDGAFDLVLLVQVDHLLPPGLLTRLLPALRPGGRLALCNREPHQARAQAALDALGVPWNAAPLAIPGSFLLLAQP